MIRAQRGDTRPQEKTLLRGVDAIDLTGAQVKYLFKARPGGTANSGQCVIPNPPTDGKVQFPVALAVGRYDAQWQITYSDGTIETVPNGQPEVLIVAQDLGD